MRAEDFFLFDAGDGVADLGEPILQFETRRIQGRTPIIGERASHRQAVATHRFGLGRTLLFYRSFERTHTPHQLAWRCVLACRSAS